MLSISSKCRYGIAAVLALTENQGQGLLQIKDISIMKDIPRQYLEQIFNRLIGAGTIKSVRGKKGGYKLAVDPAGLTVLDVIDILEGGVHLIDDNFNPLNATHLMFKKVEDKIRQLLSVSFMELESEQHSLSTNAMYHI
jgi:Rrf2 family protein